MADVDLSALKAKKCQVCEIGAPPMQESEISEYLFALDGWELQDSVKIRKEFKFGDFREAMTFVNKVADIAEAEGHDPSIFISYNKVRITLTTHSIKGLSENDFIMAVKIETLLGG